jgi:hypothetical protein
MGLPCTRISISRSIASSRVNGWVYFGMNSLWDIVVQIPLDCLPVVSAVSVVEIPRERLVLLPNSSRALYDVDFHLEPMTS